MATTSDWIVDKEPVSNGQSFDWIVDKEPYTPTSTPTYDITNKKALKQTQIDLIKNNPDFKLLSRLEKARILGEASGNKFDLSDNENDFRKMAKEGIVGTANALGNVGNYLNTLYQTGKTALTTGDLGQAAQAGIDTRRNNKPLIDIENDLPESLQGASRVGDIINKGFKGTEKGLGYVLNNPELASQIMDVVGTTLGIAPVAKGFARATPKAGVNVPIVERPAGVMPGEIQPPLQKFGWGEGYTEPSLAETAGKATLGAAVKTADAINPFNKGVTVGSEVSRLEPVKQYVSDLRSPTSLKNTNEKSIIRLARPKDVNLGVPENRRNYINNVNEGVKEVIQQVEDGRIYGVDEAGNKFPSEFKPNLDKSIPATVKSRQNLYSEEIQPAINDTTLPIDTNVIADYWADKVKAYSHGRTPALLKNAMEQEAFYRNKKISAAEAQNIVSTFNESYNGNRFTVDNPAMVRDTIGESTILKTLLDQAVDAKLEGLGLSELKKRYGGVRAFENAQLEAGIEALKKEHKNAWNSLDTIAGGEFIVGSAKFNPKLMLASVITESLSQLIKRNKKPDVLLARIYRTRKSLGDNRREIYKPEPPPEIIPDSTKFAPEIGVRIPTRLNMREVGGVGTPPMADFVKADTPVMPTTLDISTGKQTPILQNMPVRNSPIQQQLSLEQVRLQKLQGKALGATVKDISKTLNVPESAILRYLKGTDRVRKSLIKRYPQLGE